MLQYQYQYTQRVNAPIQSTCDPNSAPIIGAHAPSTLPAHANRFPRGLLNGTGLSYLLIASEAGSLSGGTPPGEALAALAVRARSSCCSSSA
jgi:hypothetical protein